MESIQLKAGRDQIKFEAFNLLSTQSEFECDHDWKWSTWNAAYPFDSKQLNLLRHLRQHLGDVGFNKSLSILFRLMTIWILKITSELICFKVEFSRNHSQQEARSAML